MRGHAVHRRRALGRRQVEPGQRRAGARRRASALSISYTTRAPRPGERHAQHYHFVGEDEFERMVAAGDFFEHALVHGDYKGTARQSVEPQLARRPGRAAGDRLAGRAPGARADAGRAQRVHPAAVARGAGIAHAQRAARTATETIARRLAAAREEMSHYDEFDFVIVNDDFEAAVREMQAIFLASRQRRHIQIERHGDLIEALLSES